MIYHIYYTLYIYIYIMYYSDVLFYPKNEGLLVTMLGFYLSVL